VAYQSLNVDVAAARYQNPSLTLTLSRARGLFAIISPTPRCPSADLRWLLGSRANCVRELWIEDGFLHGDATVPALVAAAILGSQAASLLSLTIQVPTHRGIAQACRPCATCYAAVHVPRDDA